ncbi:hypothetical protein [Streptomyces sp. NPDC002746]
MSVLFSSTDTAVGQVSLVLKHGPSTYRPWTSVRTGNGPLGALLALDRRGFVATSSTSSSVCELDLVSEWEREWNRVGWGPRELGVVSYEDGAPQYEYLDVVTGPSGACLVRLSASIPWPV